MNQRDWDRLRYDGVKKTLLQEVPLQIWFQDAYGNPTAGFSGRLDEVTDKIMEHFRLFTHKLEDEIHRQHHDG